MLGYTPVPKTTISAGISSPLDNLTEETYPPALVSIESILVSKTKLIPLSSCNFLIEFPTYSPKTLA